MWFVFEWWRFCGNTDLNCSHSTREMHCLSTTQFHFILYNLNRQRRRAHSTNAMMCAAAATTTKETADDTIDSATIFAQLEFPSRGVIRVATEALISMVVPSFQRVVEEREGGRQHPIFPRRFRVCSHRVFGCWPFGCICRSRGWIKRTKSIQCYIRYNEWTQHFFWVFSRTCHIIATQISKRKWPAFNSRLLVDT